MMWHGTIDQEIIYAPIHSVLSLTYFHENYNQEPKNNRQISKQKSKTAAADSLDDDLFGFLVELLSQIVVAWKAGILAENFAMSQVCFSEPHVTWGHLQSSNFKICNFMSCSKIFNSYNTQLFLYSHLFNKRGAWNKHGGGAKVAKSLNVEVGINVEGGIFWKKLVHKSNKRGVEGGKI